MRRWCVPATAAGLVAAGVATAGLLAAGLGAAGLLGPPTHQESQGDTLAALLVEVRHIRSTMDRVATVSPRIQILLTQLQLQHWRVERLTNEVNGHRSAVGRITDSINRGSDTLQRIDGAIAAESDPQRRKDLEREREALKVQIEGLTAENQRAQAVEAEAAGRLQVEQLQLDELTRKLAELERELATPRR